MQGIPVGRTLLLALAGLTACKTVATAAEPTRTELVSAASVAFVTDKLDEALAAANRLVKLDANDTEALQLRAMIQQQRREFAAAIADLDQILKLQPDRVPVLERRGSIKFQAGRILDSIADFDRIAELQPEREASLWKRGIAFYYAGRDDRKFYERGRQQFEIYQTFDDNNVENAVWRYLCMAPLVGKASAGKEILKIKQDTRVPMMEIHALYSGTIQPAEVLKAANAGTPSKSELNSRLFYAHLYLGLYQETLGDLDAAREHLKLAVHHKISHYMWDVANVHADLLKKPVAKTP